MLKEDIFERLAHNEQIVHLQHDGFFSVDTFKDYLEINSMVERGETPWMVWERRDVPTPRR